MPIIKGLEWTFDTVAAAYDKYRPGYVEELYRALFSYLPIDESSRVVEIGIGSGQATLPVLQTGCELTAIEYGEHFAELCREKFRGYPKFSVITGRFEDTDFQDKSVDLIFSATAFHWIPEQIGYPKVFSMLKSGGVFCRFANHPCTDKGRPALAEEIDRLYDEYYYRYHRRSKDAKREYGAEEAEQLALTAEKYGFADIQYALFHRTRSFTAGEYTTLLGTYSDHIAIEEAVRREFFARIEEAINRFGGTFTIYDTIDLQLARKP